MLNFFEGFCRECPPPCKISRYSTVRQFNYSIQGRAQEFEKGRGRNLKPSVFRPESKRRAKKGHHALRLSFIRISPLHHGSFVHCIWGSGLPLDTPLVLTKVVVVASDWLKDVGGLETVTNLFDQTLNILYFLRHQSNFSVIFFQVGKASLNM